MRYYNFIALAFFMTTVFMLSTVHSSHAREIENNVQSSIQCINATYSNIPQSDDPSILDRYNNENRNGQFEKVQICTPPQADIVLAPTTIPTLSEVTAWFGGTLQAAAETIKKIIIDQFAKALLEPLFALFGLNQQDYHEASHTEIIGTDALNTYIEGATTEALQEKELSHDSEVLKVTETMLARDEAQAQDYCRIASEKIASNYTMRWAERYRATVVDRFIGQFMNTFYLLGTLVDDEASISPIGSRFAALGYQRQNANFTKIQVDDIVDPETAGRFSYQDPLFEIANLAGQYKYWCSPEGENNNAGEDGAKICPQPGTTFTFNGRTVRKPGYQNSNDEQETYEGTNIKKRPYESNDVIFGSTFFNPNRRTFKKEVDFGGAKINLDEQAAVDFMRNIFGRNFPPLEESEVNESTDVVDYLMEKRRLTAIRSVALTSFADLIGRHAPSPIKQSKSYIKEYLEEKAFAGMEDNPETKGAVKEILDSVSDRPSKETLLEVMSRMKGLNPTYFFELSKVGEEHFNQKLLEIGASESVLMYEILEASLRREALMASLLEISLTDERNKLEGFNRSITNIDN